MLIVCFAVGRDRDNWRGRKAWREGKGFSPSFCWFLFHAHCVSPCVSVFSESQSCAAYYEKSNFNRARRNTRQFRQHVFSPSGTAWFCRARRRDGDRRWKGEHGLNLSPFASITIRCCPTSILIIIFLSVFCFWYFVDWKLDQLIYESLVAALLVMFLWSWLVVPPGGSRENRRPRAARWTGADGKE